MEQLLQHKGELWVCYDACLAVAELHLVVSNYEAAFVCTGGTEGRLFRGNDLRNALPQQLRGSSKGTHMRYQVRFIASQQARCRHGKRRCPVVVK